MALDELERSAPGVVRRFRELLLLAIEEAMRRPVVRDELVFYARSVQRPLEGRDIVRGDPRVGAAHQPEDRSSQLRRALRRSGTAVPPDARPAVEAHGACEPLLLRRGQPRVPSAEAEADGEDRLAAARARALDCSGDVELDLCAVEALDVLHVGKVVLALADTRGSAEVVDRDGGDAAFGEPERELLVETVEPADVGQDDDAAPARLVRHRVERREAVPVRGLEHDLVVRHGRTAEYGNGRRRVEVKAHAERDDTRPCRRRRPERTCGLRPCVRLRFAARPAGTPNETMRRRGPDSNRCTRLCRPLPNPSATAPGRRMVSAPETAFSRRYGVGSIRRSCRRTATQTAPNAASTGPEVGSASRPRTAAVRSSTRISWLGFAAVAQTDPSPTTTSCAYCGTRTRRATTAFRPGSNANSEVGRPHVLAVHTRFASTATAPPHDCGPALPWTAALDASIRITPASEFAHSVSPAEAIPNAPALPSSFVSATTAFVTGSSFVTEPGWPSAPIAVTHTAPAVVAAS